MKFLGPISKDLTGPGAEELLAQARLLLGQVRNDMRLGGRQQGWGHWDLDAERRMRCYSNWNGGAPIDMVWVETIGGKVIPETLILENGMVTWSNTPDEAAHVYSGDVLTSYFASAGTLLAGADEGVYLQGEATVTPDPESPNHRLIEFPTSAPGSEYTSSVWTGIDSETGERDIPSSMPEELEEFTSPAEEYSYPKSSRYTGLLRLAVQSKIGAGKSVLDLVPEEWLYPRQLSGALHGILTDPAGRWWICQISNNGVTAQAKLRPLATDPDLEFLWEQLSTLEGQDRTLAQAWLLASATASVDASDILAWGPVSAPTGWALGHGWHYNRAGTEASIVLVDDDLVDGLPCHFSTFHTLSFSWSQQTRDEQIVYVPSARLTSSTSSHWRINSAYHQLWYPAPFPRQEYWLHCTQPPYGLSVFYEPFRGAIAPIYCYYDSDDALQTISYNQYYMTSQSADEVLAGLECGASYYHRVIGERLNAEGGFDTPSHTSTNNTTYQGSFEKRWMNFVPGSGTMNLVHTYIYSTLPGLPICEPIDFSHWVYPSRGIEVWSDAGGTPGYAPEVKKQIGTINTAKMMHSLIIPESDAESVISLTSYREDKTSVKEDKWTDCWPLYAQCNGTLRFVGIDLSTQENVEIGTYRIVSRILGENTSSGIGYFVCHFTGWINPDICSSTHTDRFLFTDVEEVNELWVSASSWSYNTQPEMGDWDAFFSGSPESPVLPIVANLVSAYSEGGVLFPVLGDVMSGNGWPAMYQNQLFMGAA